MVTEAQLVPLRHLRAAAEDGGKPRPWALALGALGVVYGDIGTSPLYAVRECLEVGTPERGHVLGVASLIFWTLILIVAVKYAGVILTADNRGEGGILALLGLARPRAERGGRAMVLVGLIGAALLMADGVITPAVSVLGAVEGLELIAPSLEPYLPAVATVILAAIFSLQSAGSGRIGALFGPVVLTWLVAIASVGVYWIAQAPESLAAIDPRHGWRLLTSSWNGYLALGGVILCATGAEALYADLGHFGRRPIRLAGYGLVFPALLLNYFGQAAYLLAHPSQPIGNVFYDLWPASLRGPALLLATLAAIVASQALISGVYSLTQQGIQLGYLPRLTIVHTSAEVEGRIYMPHVNALLFVGCVGLTLTFGSSSALGSAYGVAVTGTMAATSVLFYFAARQRLGSVCAGAIVGTFLVLDLSLLVANLPKLLTGAWVTLAIAGSLLAVMFVWQAGNQAVRRRLDQLQMPLEQLLDRMRREQLARVPGAAVFFSREEHGAPPMLTLYVSHARALQAQVVLLHVHTLPVPRVEDDARLTVHPLSDGFSRVIASYGFIEIPDLRAVLARLQAQGVLAPSPPPSLFVGHSVVVPARQTRLERTRVGLFAFLLRNSQPASAHFRLPTEHVVELGVRVEI